jgi:hypothetical protein
MQRLMSDVRNQWGLTYATNGGARMTANVHPTSGELLAALHEPDRGAATLGHLDVCLACRVRLSRIRAASGFAPPSADGLQRIVEASTPLPDVLADILSNEQDGQPQPNEIWRVGRSEALLVWVRQVFDDGVADVIPLVLDVELADQESVLVSANATPLATEIAVIVPLRTHIHLGAFLNRVGSLDIGKDVAEVMAAVREGRRPSGVRVGPPIDEGDDQRLEYRQALRDLLAELSPSAWLETQDEAGCSEQRASEPTVNRSLDEIDIIEMELGERLPGAQCRRLEPHTITVDAAIQATSVLKVVYLDTAVLVATLHGANLTAFPELVAVAAACQKLGLIETDIDAVAVTIPRNDWQALLFTTSYMRGAIELPTGVHTGPSATLEGYGLVDTLYKHLEGALPAWEITESAGNYIGRADVHQIAQRHASASIAQITVEGKRAHQTAKKTAWTSLPDELEERVAKFVVAIVNKKSMDDAWAELALEIPDD